MSNTIREYLITSDISGDRCAGVYDPSTGNLLNHYKHSGTNLAYHTIQILKDSYLIGADSTKPRLHLWPLKGQTPTPNLRLATPGKVTSLACSPDGSFAVAGINEKLYVWQICNGRLLKTLSAHYQTVTCVTFSADGSCFASAGEDNLVLVWSLARAVVKDSNLVSVDCSKPLFVFSSHTQPVKDICFGSFGNRALLCSVSLDKSLKIMDASAGILLLSLIFDEALTAVTIDTLENHVFVGFATGKVRKVDLRDPPRERENYVAREAPGAFANSPHQGNVVSLSVSMDCTKLASGDNQGNVCIWDIATGVIARTLKHKGPVSALLFATAFENYTSAKFRPSLLVGPLNWANEEEKLLEVIGGDGEDLLRRSDELKDKGTNEDVELAAKGDARDAGLRENNLRMFQFCVEKLLPSRKSGKRTLVG